MRSAGGNTAIQYKHTHPAKGLGWIYKATWRKMSCASFHSQRLCFSASPNSPAFRSSSLLDEWRATEGSRQARPGRSLYCMAAISSWTWIVSFNDFPFGFSLYYCYCDYFRKTRRPGGRSFSGIWIFFWLQLIVSGRVLRRRLPSSQCEYLCSATQQNFLSLNEGAFVRRLGHELPFYLI